MSSVMQAGPCVRSNQLDYDEDVMFKVSNPKTKLRDLTFVLDLALHPLKFIVAFLFSASIILSITDRPNSTFTTTFDPILRQGDRLP
jgi:hypothetical protein